MGECLKKYYFFKKISSFFQIIKKTTKNNKNPAVIGFFLYSMPSKFVKFPLVWSRGPPGSRLPGRVFLLFGKQIESFASSNIIRRHRLGSEYTGFRVH